MEYIQGADALQLLMDSTGLNEEEAGAAMIEAWRTEDLPIQGRTRSRYRYRDDRPGPTLPEPPVPPFGPVVSPQDRLNLVTLEQPACFAQWRHNEVTFHEIYADTETLRDVGRDHVRGREIEFTGLLVHKGALEALSYRLAGAAGRRREASDISGNGKPVAWTEKRAWEEATELVREGVPPLRIREHVRLAGNLTSDQVNAYLKGLLKSGRPRKKQAAIEAAHVASCPHCRPDLNTSK
jgi:hypothetical protein